MPADPNQFKLRLDDDTVKEVDRYASFVKGTTGAELSRTEAVTALVHRGLIAWDKKQPPKSKR